MQGLVTQIPVWPLTPLIRFPGKEYSQANITADQHTGYETTSGLASGANDIDYNLNVSRGR